MTAAVRCFFNAKAETWDTLNGGEAAERSARLIEGLRIKEGSKVLDVGCGTGIIIPLLLRAVGDAGSVTAMDIAERMLCAARAKHDRPNLEYIHADIVAAPFIDGSFDEIVCHNCFPHVGDRQAALREMLRILKPGGRATICHNESRETMNAMHRRVGGGVTAHMLPHEGEMRELLESAGFVGVSIEDGRESYLLQAYRPGGTT